MIGLYIATIGFIITLIVVFNTDCEFLIPVGVIITVFASLLALASSPTDIELSKVMESTTYEIVSLHELDEEYKENDYILYNHIDNELVIYYKDNLGIPNVLSIDKDKVVINYNNEETPICICEERDYESGLLRHLFLNMYDDTYTITLPEGSKIITAFPDGGIKW